MPKVRRTTKKSSGGAKSQTDNSRHVASSNSLSEKTLRDEGMQLGGYLTFEANKTLETRLMQQGNRLWSGAFLKSHLNLVEQNIADENAVLTDNSSEADLTIVPVTTEGATVWVVEAALSSGIGFAGCEVTVRPLACQIATGVCQILSLSQSRKQAFVRGFVTNGDEYIFIAVNSVSKRYWTSAKFTRQENLNEILSILTQWALKGCDLDLQGDFFSITDL
ncbi:hypothetical protein GYMLUDRAFT_59206 [Collybiopsis luxurians FD-317 M1]|uniref:Uncharacterized protein n=1 Tax=Collybiopsis luxurians FD-317 M1 TaxID=944289 RepID=A0A0D0BYC1_9AGAR|nr:hypothetical protein GYMLUDRAFT_59206 [Collybiopsis luxurians FD-317 M1]